MELQLDNVPYKKPFNKKNKIIQATRELFYELGYDGYSVESILERAHVSRGTFYHYFTSKDDVLVNWVLLYDDNYQEWSDKIDVNLDPIEKLSNFSRCVLSQQGEMNIEIKKKQFAAQALSRGNSYFFDSKRKYYTIVESLVEEGHKKGTIRADLSKIEITNMLLTIHRGAIYDWCVANASYSLEDYGMKLIAVFLKGLQDTSSLK